MGQRSGGKRLRRQCAYNSTHGYVICMIVGVHPRQKTIRCSMCKTDAEQMQEFLERDVGFGRIKADIATKRIQDVRGPA